MGQKSQNFSTIKYFYIYVFCSLTERQTDKISKEQMYIDQMNLHKKNQSSIVNSNLEIDVSIHVCIYIQALCSLCLTDKLFIVQMLFNWMNINKKESDVYLTQQTKKSHFCILQLCLLQPDQQPDGKNIYRIDVH